MSETIRVELLRNIPHLHLSQGDILMCTNSGWDPEKVRVLRRESTSRTRTERSNG